MVYGLQSAKEVLGFAENGEEPWGIFVDHYGEDKLLPLDTDAFELVGDWDETLHFSKVAHSDLLERWTEL